MLARWLAKLQQFHFDIVHRPGAQHGNVDGLSRCPQCERGLCAPTKKTHQTDPDQPYANSSSMELELIPLESGETCVAAIMTAQSDNSKLIIAAQNIDKDISIVHHWITSGQFPACVQDFAPASYELKAYWIGRKRLYLDTEDILWRTRSATGSRTQLVVPLSLRDTVFNDNHNTTYRVTSVWHTHTARYSYITSGLECQISSGTISLHVTSVFHANHQWIATNQWDMYQCQGNSNVWLWICWT